MHLFIRRNKNKCKIIVTVVQRSLLLRSSVGLGLECEQLVLLSLEELAHLLLHEDGGLVLVLQHLLLQGAQPPDVVSCRFRVSDRTHARVPV